MKQEKPVAVFPTKREDYFNGCQLYVKKALPIRAVKMQTPFKVETPEGVVIGQKGDWLIEGVQKELYPCRDDIFTMSYITLGEADTEKKRLEARMQALEDELSSAREAAKRLPELEAENEKLKDALEYAWKTEAKYELKANKGLKKK